jgi:hypothetical protein
MSYGKYGFKKTGAKSNSADKMAINDPMFALGQLLGSSWSKNYEDRGIRKAVDEYGVDSLLPKETAPTQDQIAAADDVIRDGEKAAVTNAIAAGAPTEAFGVRNYMAPPTADVAANAVPAYKQAAAFNAPNIYGTAQQNAQPQTVFGTIDTSKIAPVNNGDGTFSTVKSMSIKDDVNGKEVLIPTVVNGKVVTPEEAIAEYKKTGNNLGMFDTVDQANAEAKRIHNLEQQRVNNSQNQPDFDADVFLAGQVAKMQKAGMDQERIQQVVALISPQAYAKQKQFNEQKMTGIMESYDKAIKAGRETGDFSQAYALIPQIEKYATPTTKQLLLNGFAPFANANAQYVADKSTKIKREDKQTDIKNDVQTYGAKKEIDFNNEMRSLMGKYQFFKDNPDALNYFSTSGKTGSAKKTAGSDGLFGTDYKAGMEILKDLRDYSDEELSPAQRQMKKDATAIITSHFDVYFGREQQGEKSPDEIANGINTKIAGIKNESERQQAIQSVTEAIRQKYPAATADAIIAKLGGGSSDGGGSSEAGEKEPTQADYDKQAAYENQLAYEENLRNITYEDFQKMSTAERYQKFDTALWPTVMTQQKRLKRGYFQ